LTQLAVADIDQHILRLFDMVAEGLTAATTAFLECDRDMARTLIAGDQSIDSLQDVTEELLYAELDRALAHRDREVRSLVAALQIVPELERSGDLVEHIALRTQQGLVTEISPLARALIGQMGRIGAEMWRTAASAYADRDGSAAEALRQRDDELDDLHVQLSVELAASGTSVPVAIEMGLVARFYERLGDHAVNVARRVSRLIISLEAANPSA
jgi:phosphate transport system protein